MEGSQLVTLAQAADRWGVSKARAYQYKSMEAFPPAITRMSNADVWDWSTLDAWRERRMAQDEDAGP